MKYVDLADVLFASDNLKKKRYTTYGLGAGMYSLNYYSFVRLCKEAGANIQIKKKVVVDLDILDAYLESVINMEGEVENA